MSVVNGTVEGERFDSLVMHAAMTPGVVQVPSLVWTAGVSPNPLLDLIDLPRGAGGRVQVDSTLAVHDRPGVFALGDCAAVCDIVTGKPYPPTAQYAIREGKIVADNVAAAIRGTAPRPFSYQPL